jgi:prolyl 4-hydroxylase
MEALLLDEENSIISLPGVLSPDECAEAIAFAEGLGFGDAPITTAMGFVMAPEIRNNTRVMLDDPARAAALWERLSPALPARMGGWRAVGLNERLRFYRYDVGQRFAWHRDGAFTRSHEERSRLTLMLYLNEDFDGGATQFDDGDWLEVIPRTGAALAFAHPVRHQGASVTRGRKYVLRTDVMFRREPPA